MNKRWPNQKVYFSKKRRTNRDFTNRVKTRYGCSICGYNKHPEALHFDHIDPFDRKLPVSKMMEYARETIKKEIRKCNILCANCHAERTIKDGHHLIKQERGGANDQH